MRARWRLARGDQPVELDDLRRSARPTSLSRESSPSALLRCAQVTRVFPLVHVRHPLLLAAASFRLFRLLCADLHVGDLGRFRLLVFQTPPSGPVRAGSPVF